MNILVTGGSSGLGEAITRQLSHNKSNIVYFTFNSSEINAKKIEAECDNSRSIKCDFTNPDLLDKLLAKIPELNLDVLINNAYVGKYEAKHFHKIELDELALGFHSNILPTIAVTQASINTFRKKKFGRIITILSSYLVNKPPTGSSVYVANKAYIQALSKVWSVENSKFNITSNCILPSFMETAFTASVDERVIDQMRQSGSILQTREVADAVDFLANASQHINGIDFIINAGENIR